MTLSKQWCVKKGEYWPNHEHKLASTIPAGTYTVNSNPSRGIFLTPAKLEHDGLIPLPGSVAAIILAEIDRFFELKDKFIERSLTHKRGVLMHGQPGTGKTATIFQLAQLVVDKVDGIVLVGLRTPGYVSHTLKMIRSAEPDRPILVLLEDIDSLLDDGEEAEWLAILDGEEQINGVVYVATTNYVKKLPDRVKCRPSRFDLVIEVKMPSADDRRAYLAAKEPLITVARREKWVELTEGMSFAHIKEFIILTAVFGLEPQAAATRLNEMSIGGE